MILRRPFAILIKNFRLIHAILTFLAFYLVYKTNLILSFYNEYMVSSSSVIGKDLTGNLYNNLMYISLFIIILGSIIILFLMLYKKKQVKLYIYNILVYIGTFIVIVYSYSITNSLEIGLVDVRTLKAVQDLLNTVFVLQIISLIIIAIRATGFNLKKFEFSKDLQDLEIEDVDSEEFEVNVDLDSDKFRRKIKRTLRHTKYIYKENKVILIGLALIIIATVSTVIYLNVGVYNKAYKKGEAFSTTGLVLQLQDSYATSTDYQGNKLVLDEEVLLVIHMNVRSITVKENTLETARFVLSTGGHNFYHQIDYSNYLYDMGITYTSQALSNEFTDYILVYKIPKNFLNNKVSLIYTDYNNKNINMDINPSSLLETSEQSTKNITEILNFENSILDNASLQINNYEISNAFRVDYNYCVSEANCYPSYEYLRPTVSGNNNKTLLKISGALSYKENTTPGIYNLYSFINSFGKINYTINGTNKAVNINLKEVKPAKTTVSSEYYIEVNDEIKNAENIQIEFNIRNKIYHYNVK